LSKAESVRDIASGSSDGKADSLRPKSKRSVMSKIKYLHFPLSQDLHSRDQRMLNPNRAFDSRSRMYRITTVV
jgi:hypothetical protein